MFSIAMRTSNDAFFENEATETARILRDIAERIEAGELDGDVHDLNGNKVGRYLLDDKE